MDYEPVWPSGSIQPTGPAGPESEVLGWKKRAACREEDPDLFFIEGRGNLSEIQTAKRICNSRCPVKMECREYALNENIVHGVWGGLSSHQRTQIRSRRRTASVR